MLQALSPEALARRSARRPLVTVALRIITFVVALALISTLLSDALTTQFIFVNTPEAQRGVDLIEDLRGVPLSTNEVVIVQSDTLTVDDPAFEQVVTGLYGDLVALVPDIIREGTLTNYYQAGVPSLVSEDRTTTIIPLTMAGDFDDATDNIEKVIEVVDKASAQSGFEVLITGQAAAGKDFQEVGQEGIERGETFGVPIALVILVLVFGALVAAFVPLVLAFVALGVAAVVGQAFPLSFFVTNIIFMIGLAVGIDYSLFIVARYREERARGQEKIDAITRAGGTAGRAVLFSGMIVVIALIGMLLVPFNVFIALGIGAILVVIASVSSALTLLPAVLSLLGDNVNRLTIPWFGGAQATAGTQDTGGFWDRVSRGVMRMPVLSLLLAGGLLVAAAVPVLDLSVGFAGVSTMPDDIPSKRGFDVLDGKFSAGNVTPVQIVIEGDIDSPRVQEGIEALKGLMASDIGNAFGQPLPLEVSADGRIALLSASVVGDAAEDAVKRIRRQHVPEAFGADAAAQVYVTGETAYNIDFFSQAKRAAYIVFPFVLGVNFLLLMIIFRSVIVPLKAVILNLLAIGATYGILVLAFQKRRRRRPGRFRPVRHHRSLDSALPILHPVWPVHGLSRLPPEPNPGAVRRDAGQYGIGRFWYSDHGTAHHRGGPDHGRRVLGVRGGRHNRVAADGLRSWGRHTSGRHHRPHGAGPGQHEAPGQVELVPASDAELAAGFSG